MRGLRPPNERIKQSLPWSHGRWLLGGCFGSRRVRKQDLRVHLLQVSLKAALGEEHKLAVMDRACVGFVALVGGADVMRKIFFLVGKNTRQKSLPGGRSSYTRRRDI